MGYELQFTDKEITPWGGLSLLKRMLDYMGFNAALDASELPQPLSNRGYRPEQLIVQFMLGGWCGANRFEHGEVTRYDTVLQRLFGFARMANFKAVIRLFRKFDQPTNDRVFGKLYAWLFGQLQIDALTLDLDSTVMTRYGVQEGAARRLQSGQAGTKLAPPADGLCGRYAHGGQSLAAPRQQPHGQQCQGLFASQPGATRS